MEGDTLDSESSKEEPASQSAQEMPVLDLADRSGVVTDSAFGDPMENITALVEWVQNYRAGLSGKVTVFMDGMGFPSGVFVLESDGSPAYTITEYQSVSESAASDPATCESAAVIERACDYVFGADISPDVRPDVWKIVAWSPFGAKFPPPGTAGWRRTPSRTS